MELKFPLFLTLIAIFVLSIILIKWSVLSKKTIKTPPSPPGFPVIGNLLQLGRHPHRSLYSFARRYGPLMLLRLGHVPVLVVSSADVAEDVLKTHDRAFAGRPQSELFDKLFYGCRDVAFAPYGESWRRKKSICVLHLLSNKMVRSFQNTRAEEISLMMMKIERAASSASPVNLNQLFATLTIDVLCKAALGRKYIGEDGTANFREIQEKFVDLLRGFNVGNYIPWLAWIDKMRGLYGEVDRIAKMFNDFLENVIQEHSEREYYHKQSDIVDVLLMIQKDKLNGFEIDEIDIKAIILDVFLAGTESSYAALEWTMTELLRHPEIMNKLRNEIRSISGKKSYVSEDEIQSMKYLKAVIKEVLRLHPPAPLLAPRESIDRVLLKGYTIEAGTQVLINAWALGREVATWGDDVEEFRPERFMNSSLDFLGHDFGFIPFGAGRRICPGIAFSMAIIELALANIVHRFYWKIAHEVQEGNFNVMETTGIAVHPKFTLVVYASPVSYH